MVKVSIETVLKGKARVTANPSCSELLWKLCVQYVPHFRALVQDFERKRLFEDQLDRFFELFHALQAVLASPQSLDHHESWQNKRRQNMVNTRRLDARNSHDLANIKLRTRGIGYVQQEATLGRPSKPPKGHWTRTLAMPKSILKLCWSMRISFMLWWTVCGPGTNWV